MLFPPEQDSLDWILVFNSLVNTVRIPVSFPPLLIHLPTRRDSQSSFSGGLFFFFFPTTLNYLFLSAFPCLATSWLRGRRFCFSSRVWSQHVPQHTSAVYPEHESYNLLLYYRHTNGIIIIFKFLRQSNVSGTVHHRNSIRNALHRIFTCQNWTSLVQIGHQGS